MKKLALLTLLLLAAIFLQGQSTTTISGPGTDDQVQPFGMWYGYERSAALYTTAEMPNNRLILSLGWYVEAADPHLCQTKIYLKDSVSSIPPDITWDDLIEGATLVYSAPTSFPTTGWNTLDIADFAYIDGSLLVLCQTDFGDNGAKTYPTFRYNTASAKHEYWADDWAPPGLTGTISDERPNIRIIHNTLSTPRQPSGLMSIPSGPAGIELSWTQNTVRDPVMIAYNTTNTFGTPSGIYDPGATISGGGTVIYNGTSHSYSHTGLLPNTTYYYRAWSVHSPGPVYSSAQSANGSTWPLPSFPSATNFESATFPPGLWTLNSLPWIRSTAASGYGTGMASVRTDFYNTLTDDFYSLISPVVDLTMMQHPALKFDHAYASSNGLVDRLELWTSADQGNSYTLLATWLGGDTGPLNTGGSSSNPFVPTSSQWATKSIDLPVGTNRVKFKGVSAYDNNLWLDNITFYNSACDPYQFPFTESLDNFTPPTTGCLTQTNNNNDAITWGTSPSNPRSAPNSMYITKNATQPMNDWFYTPALELQGGITYLVSFWYRGSSPAYTEKLEVKWGSAPIPGSMMINPIWSNSSIQTQTYTLGTATFTPDADGNYYIGWHGYSEANMGSIYVDDITLDIANITWNGNYSDDWNDPMNWTPVFVPGENHGVVIPAGAPNFPIIESTGLICRQLTINSNAEVTVSSSSDITINENVILHQNAVLNNEGIIIIKGDLDIVQP
jgi:hypothetical protein